MQISLAANHGQNNQGSFDDECKEEGIKPSMAELPMFITVQKEKPKQQLNYEDFIYGQVKEAKQLLSVKIYYP